MSAVAFALFFLSNKQYFMIYICMYVCMYALTCARVCVCVRACLCVCVCVCVIREVLYRSGQQVAGDLRCVNVHC